LSVITSGWRCRAMQIRLKVLDIAAVVTALVTVVNVPVY